MELLVRAHKAVIRDAYNQSGASSNHNQSLSQKSQHNFLEVNVHDTDS